MRILVVIAAAVVAFTGLAGAGAWYFIGTMAAPPPDIALPVPSGYCLLTPESRAVENSIETQKWLNRDVNHVLAMFASCSQLGRFRRGEGFFMDSNGTYLAEMDRPDGELADSREAYLADLEEALRAQDPEATVADDLARRISAFYWNLQIERTRNLGVIAADDVAVYVGLVQTVVRPLDHSATLVATVIGMTLLDGAAVTLTLSAPHEYAGAVDDLLAAQTVNMRDLVAANDG